MDGHVLSGLELKWNPVGYNLLNPVPSGVNSPEGYSCPNLHSFQFLAALNAKAEGYICGERQIIWYRLHVESEKMIQMTLQNWDRCTDFENKLMDAFFLNVHPGTVSGSYGPEIKWKILGSSLEFGWKNIQTASVSEPQFTASESDVWVSESCSVVSDSLQPYGLINPRNSPGWNSGVGSLSLLQGIFPIYGSNPGLLHCRQILYQLSHKGSPGSGVTIAMRFREVKKEKGKQLSFIKHRKCGVLSQTFYTFYFDHHEKNEKDVK